MTISNHDHEIEKRAHPENFDARKSPGGWIELEKRGVPILPDPRLIKIKKAAKRGSAKEVK